MQWLFANYKWLFDGVGAVVVIGLFGYLLKRFFKVTEPVAIATKNTLGARDSHVSGSPVISGSGNVTHIHVGQSPTKTTESASPAPIATTKGRPSPNLRQTAAKVVRVNEPYPGRFDEAFGGKNEAIVIQFTNEAKSNEQNVGAPVKASLVYEDNKEEVLRIIGGWLHEISEVCWFQVDESHKLIVGVRTNKGFTAIEMRRKGTSDVAHPDICVLLPFQTVSVRLTHASTGDVLFEGRFRVTVDPLTIVQLIEGTGASSQGTPRG